MNDKVTEWCTRRTFKFMAATGCVSVASALLLHVLLPGAFGDLALLLLAPWCLVFTMWSSQRAAAWAAHESNASIAENRGGIIFPKLERRQV